MTLERQPFPTYPTASCPRNRTALERRSNAINCNETNGYMCFPNNELTELKEFCYTYPRIGIVKGIYIYLFDI